MKILHTSDWHIGRSLYGRKRYDEFSAFLDWLAEFIQTESVDALLIAGDIFDTSTPSNRAQELYYRFLCKVSASCCRHIVVIAGNHDSPSFLNAPKELLRALNVHVVGSITDNSEDEVRELYVGSLIRSADGKKYRNFAQGLTFELMVSHANRQLEKMTDRYLLVRDEDQPLELNVVDNYQAGEIRSTKNLSGGESFIVSLSLALGLSKMASRKVRVDSLFLDEGFGTLDEDALETALETLSGLKQDSKLIGIISHVPALKERISTQITVQPVSGGKSVINGPGCERIIENNKNLRCNHE